MPRAGFALITSATALTCLWLGGGRSSEAAEADAATVQVAAVAIDSDRVDHPPDARAERESGELEWLVAQLPPSGAAEASGETVLAVFAASTPEAVEEEIAKAHKLERVRRLEIGSREKRVVLYRITDGRNPADVVAALRNDARVSTAQPNARYAVAPQLPPPAPPAISAAPPVSPRSTKQARHRTARPERKVQPPAAIAATQEPAAPGSALSLRRSERGGLVAKSQTALRFPTADEPFVNIGVRNR
ncbi:MAG TPA: hypothetical protein VJ740_11880 [Hyphomicrobiaceae bacterium]|nr:hypothetical protein [Hyphomicrobiaceae bacterium]